MDANQGYGIFLIGVSSVFQVSSTAVAAAANPEHELARTQ